MKSFSVALVGCLPMALPASLWGANEVERPNIVWFLTEDVSSHYLAHFNEGHGAATPNVERLAKHGVTFMNAYSCAPVSSAARTTLITGCYAPSFEGSFHRAFGKKTMSDMPGGLKMFPSYLRRVGYYTCNAHKTDYNVKLDNSAWNEINGTVESWQTHVARPQPFFLMRTTMTTHEGKVQFNQNHYLTEKTLTSLDSVYLHPSLPDTRLMRYTYATFYDRIKESDQELGEIIDILEKAGKLDDTFIFYFGDNGGSLPGTKGYTNDIGFHVPLVVYVPEKWKDKVSQNLGATESGLVSFMDFAPTVLKLAGVDIPARMDGTPFLGKDVNLSDRVVYGYGDRYDEFYAFNRCIREGKYRYARNYQPNHPRSLFAFFRYKQLAFREWKDLYDGEKLLEEQQKFFMPMGAEELYDLEADPDEMHNLAADPAYHDVVTRLRSQLNQYLTDKADLGFFPETVVQEEALPKMDVYGQQNKERIARFIEVADLQTEVYSPSVEAALRKALTSDDAVERWWGLTTCAYFGEAASGLEKEITDLLNDSRAYVASKALVASSILGNRYDKQQYLAILKKSRKVPEVLLLLNDLAFLYESELIAPFFLTKEELPLKNRFADWRLNYLNSYVTADNAYDRWKDIYSEEADVPVQPENPEGEVAFFASFLDDEGDFSEENPLGEAPFCQVWTREVRNGDICMRAQNLWKNHTHAIESWWVSPVIDLENSVGSRLSFDNAAYGFHHAEGYVVKVRIVGEEWQNITLQNRSKGMSWNYVTTTGDLKSYDGKKIQLAFAYSTMKDELATWDIKNVMVQGDKSTGIADIFSPSGKNIIYDRGGRWVKAAENGLYIINGKKIYRSSISKRW